MKTPSSLLSANPHALLLGLSMLCQIGWSEGLPEPNLVLYGTIRNTAAYNARITSGTLIWRFRRQDTGRTITLTNTLGNVSGQFSYLLLVPCETVLSGASVSSNSLELLPSSLTYDRSQVTLDGLQVSFATPGQAATSLAARNRGVIERVDLLINAPCQDSDGLGLCDWWEDLYFGGIGHRPGDDEDGDGMTNLQEFIAGTDPNDPNSVFHFIKYSRQPLGGFEVQWNSAEGRSYTLLRSATLLPGSFSIIRSNIAGTPPMNSFLDTNTPSSGPLFYNLFIQP
ncbi:MAG: thrombospondin type 3 repeat-containing protein [Verrucomicrobiota bacterium]